MSEREHIPDAARNESDWYVDQRPLDVLLPHVPGFEVVSDEDAEWKCIARNEEIGQQISEAINAHSALVEAARFALWLLNGSIDPIANADTAVRKLNAALALTETEKK